MKKIYLVFAILLVNSVFISCTDVEENLENETIEIGVSATGGEDGQLPDEDDD